MKTLKLSLTFCLLICLFLVSCGKGGNDKDDSPLFDGNIIYAPSGLGDDHITHIHAPSTSAPDTDDITETSDGDTEIAEPPSDTDTGTDTASVSDTEPTSDTDEPSDDTTTADDKPSDDTTAADDEPAEDTTAAEESTLAPIEPDDGYGIIDMRETLAVGFPVSGQFISAENSRLALAVNYDCSMAPDGKVTVTLDVGLLAHAIRCGGRPKDMGELTIDGVTYNFSTKEIVNESSGQIYIPFYSHTYTVEAHKSSSTIDASWMFNGSYGGERIKELSASARLVW